MNFQYLFAFLLCSMFFLQQSCNKDTCNDAETFTQINAQLLADSTAINLGLNWIQGKPLPKNYFEEIFIYKSSEDRYGKPWQNDYIWIDTVLVNSASNLSIVLSSEVDNDIPREFFFHFIFPDRRNFIECEHPGSNDDYHLDISFKLFIENDSLKIMDFLWEEKFIAGPF